MDDILKEYLLELKDIKSKIIQFALWVGVGLPLLSLFIGIISVGCTCCLILKFYYKIAYRDDYKHTEK